MTSSRFSLLCSVGIAAMLASSSVFAQALIVINNDSPVILADGQSALFSTGAGPTSRVEVHAGVIAGGVKAEMPGIGMLQLHLGQSAIDGDIENLAQVVVGSGAQTEVSGSISNTSLLFTNNAELVAKGTVSGTNIRVLSNAMSNPVLTLEGENNQISSVTLQGIGTSTVGTFVIRDGSTSFSNGIGASNLRLRHLVLAGGNAKIGGDFYAEDVQFTEDSALTVSGSIFDARVTTMVDGVGTLKFNSPGGVVISPSGAFGVGSPINRLREVAVDGGMVQLQTQIYANKLSIASSGLLTVVNDGSTAPLEVANIVNNGNLVIDRSGDAIIVGDMTGAGQLHKQGSGALTLTGNNDHAETIVTDGILIGSAASMGKRIWNDAEVVFDQQSDGTYAGSIASWDNSVSPATGRMVKAGAGTLTLTGRSDLAWKIDEGNLVSDTAHLFGDAEIAANAALVFDQTFVGSYGGKISGTGKVVFDANLVTLTGNSNGYAGHTNVAGLLSVNGQLGGTLTVASGGRLQGTGSVSNVQVQNLGTFAPGNSIGTTTVVGNVTFDAGSTYEVEVKATGASDQILADSATLNGGTVVVIPLAGSYNSATTYSILKTTGAVTGQFAGASTSDLAFLTPTLSHSGNEVTMTLTRRDGASGGGGSGNGPVTGGGNSLFASAARTTNQRASANAVESLGSSSPVYQTVMVQTTAGAEAAFDALSGEVFASQSEVMVADSSYIRNGALDRARTAMGNNVLSDLDVGGPTETAPMGDSATAWLGVYGSRSWLQNDGNAADTEGWGGGVQIGADDWFGDLRLGAMLNIGAGRVTSDGRSSAIDSTTFGVGAYGATRLSEINVLFGAAYERSEFESTRTVAFPGFSETLTANYGGDRLQVFGEASQDFEIGGGRISPYGQLAYVRSHIDGFAEAGGASALSVNARSEQALFTTIGVRGATNFVLGDDFVVKAGAGLGWRHAFIEDVTTTHAFSAGGDAFSVAGAPIAKDALLLEAAIGLDLSAQTSLQLNYAGQIAGGAQDHSLAAALKIKF